ncbi:MarR family winged helix-turn-helix transcriptional regulator [Ovoidimarina sediminis]|uniref:MarR family winged helix-turn-helix transcriptional regulator n=1 Tax=Ovoidimarina sediminis TaxID=3079856 RepID=UPI002908C9AC|nr:MarR family transcriptional regulator [Rhodophyticola sp. MJ-SS7]MDU8943128.1 MarR family transcriptional regulator [Rhodophyticola sp. MJ-SS7]
MSVSDAALRRFTGYGMKRAFNAIQADVNRTLKPHGLRMVTFSALSVIGENPGLSQAQLADALSIERPNIVMLIDELEAAGLVLRERHAADRRAYALALTGEGRRRLARADRAVRAHDARMTAGLSTEDRARLMEMLGSVERAGEEATG